MKKKLCAFRIDEDLVRVLKVYSKMVRLSQVDVLQLFLRDLGEREGILKTKKIIGERRKIERRRVDLNNSDNKRRFIRRASDRELIEANAK